MWNGRLSSEHWSAGQRLSEYIERGLVRLCSFQNISLPVVGKLIFFCSSQILGNLYCQLTRSFTAWRIFSWWVFVQIDFNWNGMRMRLLAYHVKLTWEFCMVDSKQTSQFQQFSIRLVQFSLPDWLCSSRLKTVRRSWCASGDAPLVIRKIHQCGEIRHLILTHCPYTESHSQDLKSKPKSNFVICLGWSSFWFCGNISGLSYRAKLSIALFADFPLHNRNGFSIGCACSSLKRQFLATYFVVLLLRGYDCK